uniref:Hydroxyacid dehydrogenase n=1 Tax=Dictyoglomus thermophilum TaxID=14 RepID=A0A7C3RLQ0_DICTH
MGFKVLITPRSFEHIKDKFWGLLKDAEIEVVMNPYGRVIKEDEMVELVRDMDGIIVGIDPITKKVIDNARKLKVISKYGVGVDNIDLEAAKERNIVVTNTPNANSNAVAELTVGLIISVLRNIPLSDRRVREKKWDRFIGYELYGKTLGVIGTGSIGKRVIKLLRGFDLNILCYDKFPDYEWAEKENVKYVDFNELLKRSDIITIHIPLTEETRHLISERELSLMKKTAIIINTSRGGIINEEDLYKFLKEEKIYGAGLDVLEDEPPKNSPLIELNNLVITSHIGAHTQESIENMAFIAVDNLISVLKGKEPKFRVC